MAGLEFEWDEAKNTANIAKHGVGFVRASGVFKDVFAIEYLDDRRDYGEERYIIIGMVDGRLLSVVYTMRNDIIRLISARGATSIEKRRYHEENS
jgi:uncharacterized DUF497 family protein